MTTPLRTPTTATCTHDVIQTWGDGTTAVMWACANPDCRLRFYPACRECVDVGHRNIVHEARAPLDVERLRSAIDAALHELGVPQPRYPAPVANAVDILRAALEEPTP